MQDVFWSASCKGSLELRLPWELGADVFARHLPDSGPASSTQGWRWVAGLRTPGKTYLARASDVETCSDWRFRPRGLATEAPPPDGPPPRAASSGSSRRFRNC